MYFIFVIYAALATLQVVLTDVVPAAEVARYECWCQIVIIIIIGLSLSNS